MTGAASMIRTAKGEAYVPLLRHSDCFNCPGVAAGLQLSLIGAGY